MGTFKSAKNPRSLADDFRSRPDKDLELLFSVRHDLLHPIPHDISELAVRAATATSVTLAIDGLNKVELVVCEVLTALPDGVDSEGVHQALQTATGYVKEAVDEALNNLWSIGLLWGNQKNLHLVRTVREFFGPYPCALGPELADIKNEVRMFKHDPDVVNQLLESAPVQAREILQEMAWENPRGHYPNAYKRINPKQVNSPVEWLLAHHLLIATDENVVTLPREVSLPMRNHQYVRVIECEQPRYESDSLDITDINSTGVHNALEFLQNFERVLNQLNRHPIAPLRTGGISTKDLSELCTTTGNSSASLTMVLDLAVASRLISLSESSGWMPNAQYEAWLQLPDENRWDQIARSWLEMKRAVITGTQNKSNRPLTTTDDAHHRLKNLVVNLLMSLNAGQTMTPDKLFNHLTWKQPRTISDDSLTIFKSLLSEMNTLGITSKNGMTSFGQAIAQGESSINELKNNLPAFIDYIIVQTDLTALAPGRLLPDIRHFMQHVAEIESTSVATVYRFTPGSILNGIESGLSADNIIERITELSRTPIPQPLTYLVQDVSRRHGQLRIGTASVYLKCDDAQLMATMLADRALSILELQQISAEIIISTQPEDIVLARLRNAGYSPSVQNMNGTISAAPPQKRDVTPLVPVAPASEFPSQRLIASAVRAMRAQQLPVSNETVKAATLTSHSTSQALELLEAALVNGTNLWIGYVDKSGQTTEHFIEPLTLSAGSLTAFDLATNQVRTFTVARIANAELSSKDHATENQEATS